jgi:uncharacterized membrane protein (UPF0182 family)
MSDTFSDTGEYVLTKISKMRPITAAFVAVLLMIFIQLLRLQSLLLDFWWFDSVGFKDIVFMVDLKAHVGMFIGAAIVSSILFYINWKAAKSFIRKLGNDDALDKIGSVYAFISVILIAILSSLFAEHYFMFLQYFNQSPFGILDPIFGNDVSFYVFTLPVIHKLLNFVFWNFAILFVADIIIWFFANKIEVNFDDPLKVMTKFRGSSKSSEDILGERDLPIIPRILLSGIIFIIGLKIYLSKYNLINATGGSNFLTGAGINDIAAFPFWLTFFGGLIIILGIFTLSGIPKLKNWNVYKKYSTILILCVVFIVGSVFMPSLWSGAYYKLNVVSSEQQVQMAYIEDSINYTRAAYGLTDIDETYYPNTVELNNSIKNSPSIMNARIFDWRAMIPFLQRSQAIERIYTFNTPDVDRYLVDGSEGQVIIAARELNPNQIPQTWENMHVIYTHGYGAVVGSVNKMGADKMPLLYSYDIPSVSSNPEFRLKEEGIWYGENTNDYILTNTKRAELDYPSSSGNVYTQYNGTGGIPIDGFLKKSVIAGEMSDFIKIMTSDYITDNSRLHLYRNVGERVARVAPFLYYDQDNSIFVDKGEENLKWMISGIAYSDSYPYSDSSTLGDASVNYVRDAAKVVVDSVNGTMDFYVVEKDPMMKTYMSIYPGLFKNIEEMPESQKLHVKYSEDLFNVQTNELSTFHMKDPELYYTKQDQWKPSSEISDSGESQVAMPYNMVLESQNGTSYVLMRTFNPADPQKTNMVSWISVDQNYPNYGKMLLYRFDKGRSLSGPAQIDAFINQDKEFSGKLTLWGQQGSTVIRGNLLVIPVNKGVINIKPIYIASSSDTNSMPELAAVIIFYENPVTGERNLKWADTVEGALDQIFIGNNNPISSNGQTNIKQELSANPLISMKILILNSNGEIVDTIPIQSNQSFVVQPVTALASGNNSSAVAA